MMCSAYARRAFTLIELMIVVAIIAILVAIAVPNILEAQVRAKIARTKSDLRAMATALEAFHADQNEYPPFFTRITILTTPVSYMSSIPRDAFRLQTGPDTGGRSWQQKWYRYGAMPVASASRYVLAGVSSDLDIDTYSSLNSGGGADTENTSNFEPDNMALSLYPGYSPELFSEAGATINQAVFKYITYDPTNGSVSNGDVFRLSDHVGN